MNNFMMFMILAIAVQSSANEGQCNTEDECYAEDRSNSGRSMLSVRKSSCPSPPQLSGKNLQTLIQGTKGVLMVAIPDMRCTATFDSAMKTKGIPYKKEVFTGPFEFKPGASTTWDWLHCTYPDDKSSDGNIMHSYVFLDGKFIGNGFAAAEKVVGGLLDKSLPKAAGSCEKRFPNEAKLVEKFMGNASTHILLFGWLSCPCVGIAQHRFAEKKLCYDGEQWEDPNSPLMSYFQCREKDSASHSFVYFRNKSGGWEFQGNGFAFDEKTMSDGQLSTKLAATNAVMTCKTANVMVNVYGRQLVECQVVKGDYEGSWMDDGKCTEETGGVHQICIEALPADFSSETHQDPWSQERRGQRHCVCVGAWSLYMTDAAKHAKGAESIMPHCEAIPETSLTTGYLQHWKDWNGYPAEVKVGISELVGRCLKSAKTVQDKCGLKMRFDKLRAEAKELASSPQLAKLISEFSKVQCPQQVSMLQSAERSAAACVSLRLEKIVEAMHPAAIPCH